MTLLTLEVKGLGGADSAANQHHGAVSCHGGSVRIVAPLRQAQDGPESVRSTWGGAPRPFWKVEAWNGSGKKTARKRDVCGPIAVGRERFGPFWWHDGARGSLTGAFPCPAGARRSEEAGDPTGYDRTGSRRPGASFPVSLIDDVSRFPSQKHLASYFGLVPTFHQSGKVEKRGHITKRGSRKARRILNQAAWAVVRFYEETPLFAFYERVAARRGQKIARVQATGLATARDFGADLLAWAPDSQEEGPTLAIQCKYWSSPVGIEAIQAIHAAKDFYRASHAVLVSNQPLTKGEHVGRGP